MFTGIVMAVGEVMEFSGGSGSRRLAVSAPFARSDIKPGDSVSVAGVCLSATVVESRDSNTIITFEVMAETLKKTTLWRLKKNNKVNLELSLRIGDRLGGHFVSGHADGVGEASDLSFGDNEVDGNDGRMLTIKLAPALRRCLAPQGSVAVDGVSLTVARLGADNFTVALTTETLARTTLRDLTVGSSVNIEVDMLAKYVVFHCLQV